MRGESGKNTGLRDRDFITIGFLALLVAWLWAGAAFGQAAGIDTDRDYSANRLRWATNTEGVLNVESGGVPLPGKWDAWVLYNFMDDPVEFSYTENGRSGALLKQRQELQFGASVALAEWFSLALHLPYTIDQFRGAGLTSDPSLGLGQIENNGVGDLRITPKFVFINGYDEGPSLALVTGLSVATATPRGAYLGERLGAVAPELAFSLPVGSFEFLLNAGAFFREVERAPGRNVKIEHEGIVRVGARAWLTDGVGLSATYEGFSGVDDLFAGDRSDGAEAMAGLHVDLADDVEFFVAGGLPVVQTNAVPDWRGMAGLRLFERYSDRDGDGIGDRADKCPEQPEDKDEFEDGDGCPEDDNDKDGFPDADDQCPNEPEDVDGHLDDDGCPDKDNDNDGIPDDRDFCPLEKEDTDGFEDDNGCPDVDNDQDGVFDDKDQCPNLPEDRDGLGDEDGCAETDFDGDGVLDVVDNCPAVKGSKKNQGCRKKQLVVIRDCKIDLSQKVYFASGKARIRPLSFSLLNNLGQVLKNQRQIKLIRIEGHTDAVGNAERNRVLSQRRAEAVRNYLISRSGISEDRLRAVGMGEDVPLEDNSTARGREANRRVELHIADCKPETKEVEAPGAPPEEE